MLAQQSAADRAYMQWVLEQSDARELRKQVEMMGMLEQLIKDNAAGHSTTHDKIDKAHDKLDKMHQDFRQVLASGDSFKVAAAISSGATIHLWELSASAFLKKVDADNSNTITPEELSDFLKGFGLAVEPLLASSLMSSLNLNVKSVHKKEARAVRMLRLLERCWSSMYTEGDITLKTLSKAECEPVMQDLAGNIAVKAVLDGLDEEGMINFGQLVGYVLRARDEM